MENSAPGKTRDLQLSVIIPVGSSENAWPSLLSQLTALGTDTEILLVHTGTPLLIGQRHPPRVREIRSGAGRARQLNKGAACARGRWLWFLHADTRLTTDVLPTLWHFMREDAIAIGYFDLRFDQRGMALTRLNALGANLRSKFLGLPFGDQGFIMRADCFQFLGSYNENVAHGEDHLFVWRARRQGLTPRRLPATLVSSARRYREKGWARTTAHHLWLTAVQIWAGSRGRA